LHVSLVGNEIWALSFITNTKPHERLDLLSATGPSSALLSTCQQINSEARGIFATARQDFWRDNKFTIDEPYDEIKSLETLMHLRNLPGKQFNIIQDLNFRMRMVTSHLHLDIRAEVVPHTENLAWRLVEISEFGTIHGLCIINLRYADRWWDPPNTSPVSIEEIRDRGGSAERRFLSPDSHATRFAQVWHVIRKSGSLVHLQPLIDADREFSRPEWQTLIAAEKRSAGIDAINEFIL
jgi:hypothetical protein